MISSGISIELYLFVSTFTQSDLKCQLIPVFKLLLGGAWGLDPEY